MLKVLGALNFARRQYAIKSDLKINWTQPEEVPIWSTKRSGDLSGPIKLDVSLPKMEFQSSSELQTADENVKKLFSLKFAKRRECRIMAQNELRKKVKQHKYDFSSEEVLLALRTEQIRWLQEISAIYPKSKLNTVLLNELVLKRARKLKLLRGLDYKKFEWVLEQLDLIYRNPPSVLNCSRKYALQTLTKIYCDQVKDEKMNELKKLLKQEQPSYLEAKIKKLTQMRNDQIRLGLEVTITEQDIEKTKQLLKSLNSSDEIQTTTS